MALAAAAALGACEKGKPPVPPPMDVLVTEVTKHDVSVYYEWIGTITGFVNAQIRPQVTGYLLRQTYDNGDLVQAGQLMFEIDPRQFQAALDQAKGELAKAEAVLGKTQIDVTRYTPLAKQGAVSQQELDNAIQANLGAKAQVDAARAAVQTAQLNLGWTKVTSPIKGVAGIAIAQVGNLVEPTTELTTVSQLDPIKVKFPVAEQEYLRYARGVEEGKRQREKGRAGTLELILADGSAFPHRGSVEVVGREVDPRTGTLTIEGYFPNPENILRPGGYGRIRATVRTQNDALLVPQRAVSELQGNYQVAVVDGGNKVNIRTIEVGDQVGNQWIVLSGLKPGERVVAEGTQKVRDGITVNPKPYGAKAKEE